MLPTCVRIWDEWADARGELGPVYGKQWRAWLAPDGGTIDQISQAVDALRSNPDSRRIMVSAWNVGELKQMALLPCHALFQFHVAGKRLSCQLYQRSADLFLGVPFNIASYALLTHMFAQQCDLEPGDFIWTGGDCHLYTNHLDQADMQLRREPYPAPKLLMRRRPATITSLPSFCSSSARPRPMPEPPPVMRMVLPVMFMYLFLSGTIDLPRLREKRDAIKIFVVAELRHEVTIRRVGSV